MNPLSKKAMLVRLSIHGWYGKKIDRRGVDAAAQTLNIERGTDEYHKYLIPSGAFSGIRAVNSSIRTYHAEKTLPWYDDGLRVLPGNEYFPYTTEMHRLRDIRSEVVNNFINAFDAHKEYARVNRAALYDEGDYPSHDELRSMFHIDIGFYPVPEADDFRVSLDADTMTKLRESIRQENARALLNNIIALKTKFKEKMVRLYIMCNNTDPAARIYGSTLESTRDTVDMIASLNSVTENNTLNEAVLLYNMHLRNLEKEVLETDVATRQRAAAVAQSITEYLDGNS